MKKDDIGGKKGRKTASFRILVRNAASSTEHFIVVDKVIDCTGVWGNSNWSGMGGDSSVPCLLLVELTAVAGIPALGERMYTEIGRIRRNIPNVKLESEKFLQKTCLIVGTGASAITTISSLCSLAKGCFPIWIFESQLTSMACTENPNSRVEVIWVARRDREPYTIVPDDPLPQRDTLYRLGNSLSMGQLADPSNFHLRYLPKTQVCSYEDSGSQLIVTVAHGHGTENFGEEQICVDEVVACVGFRPDDRLWQEVQVHVCYATGGPMKLAAAIMSSGGSGDGDCLQQAATDKSALINVEPGFFVIGSKSYGRNSAFLLSLGHVQVRQVLELLKSD